MSDKILTIMDSVKARLEGSTAFAGITILTEDQSEIETEIEKALASLGLFILINNPSFTNREGSSRVIPNGDLVVPIEVFENPTLNRTGPGAKVCREVAWNVLRRMVQWKPGDGYQYARPQSAQPVISLDQQIYRIDVEFQVGLEPLNT
jgi:hypothetical protein